MLKRKLSNCHPSVYAGGYATTRYGSIVADRDLQQSTQPAFDNRPETVTIKILEASRGFDAIHHP